MALGKSHVVGRGARLGTELRHSIRELAVIQPPDMLSFGHSPISEAWAWHPGLNSAQGPAAAHRRA